MTAYTGKKTVVHRVAKGESLTTIAQNYGFKDWKPLWLYNTAIKNVLGPDPDLIRENEDIFIPRTAAGYNFKIKALRELRRGVDSIGEQTGHRLDGDHNRLLAFEEGIKFVQDVATLVATVGLKAAEVAKARRIARNTIGRGRIAAEYLADKRAQDLATTLRDRFKDEAIDAIAEKSGREEVIDSRKLYKHGKNSVRAIREVSLQPRHGKIRLPFIGKNLSIGKSILDISELLLDHLDATDLACAYLKLTGSQTPDQAYEDAQKINGYFTRYRLQGIDRQIDECQKEMRLLYGAD